jgi:serralysin
MANIAISPANSINSSVTHGIFSADATNNILVTTGAWVLTSAAGGGFSGIRLDSAGTASANRLSIDGTVGSNDLSGIHLPTGGATIVIGKGGYVSGLSGQGIAVFLASDITNAGTIAGTTGIVMVAAGNVINNAGLIRGTSSNGIDFQSLSAGSNVLVNSGTISSDTSAIVSGLQNDTITNTGLLAGAVLLGNGINVLTNDGGITGLVTVGTGNDTVTNQVHGVIGGDLTLGDGVNTVTNDGTITGLVTAGTGNDTVTNHVHGVIGGGLNVGGGNNTVTNDGEIAGSIVGGSLTTHIYNAGTVTGSTAIQLGGAGEIVSNTGLIRGTSGDGVFFASLLVGSNTVVNSGTISSDFNAIRCSVQDDTITNTGLLAGAVVLGNGLNVITNDGTITGLVTGGTSSDTVTNRGLIGGNINLGDGANVYDGAGGTLHGTLFMGSGNDSVIGGAGKEQVDSGDGNDTISLGGGDDIFLAAGSADGNDTIDGGDGRDTYDATGTDAAVIIDLDEGLASGTSIGNDLLASVESATGSAFDDTLTGDDFANILKGLAGVDIISGASGKDTLDGGDGADTLTGGAARDLLYGGGADGDIDIFDYNSVAESGITGGTRDAIMDFEDGLDKIDLSTIDSKTFQKGNQAFTFIGAGSFTSAGGQVRSFVNAAGNTVIQINTDKDTAVEMSIVVHGTPTLSALDFIL